jgi:alpha-1,2-mannosyltransferase
VYLRWPAYFAQTDALVYRFGGQRVRDGLDLYSSGLFGSHRILLFTYTPFAALCFVPLTFLSRVGVQALLLASTGVLLTYAVYRMLYVKSIAPQARWGITMMLAGLCLWLEPVRYSAEYGQINMLLLAIVVADVLGDPQRRWAGIGVGLAVGIKLTPMIFLIYLALIGRVRAAAVGFATFVATVLVGFAATQAI